MSRPSLSIAILAAFLLCAVAAPVAATDISYTGQAISISSPGSYTLTNDIADCMLATCIEIRSSDVVLDGGGHLVAGTYRPDSIGIAVRGAPGLRNVTVRNVRVRAWDYGVYLRGATDSSIESSVLENNLFCGAAFYLDATGNTVARCNVTANDYGIVLSAGADGCTVRDSRTERNGCGVYVYDSCSATVTRNVIGASSDAGVLLFRSGRCLVYDNRFENDLNVAFAGEPVGANAWSVGPRAGPNVVGGPSIGGNFWARPDGTGFSEVVADGDRNGFSDLPLVLAPGNVDDRPLAPSVGFVPTPAPTPTFEQPPEPTPTFEPPDPTPTAEPATSTPTPALSVPVPLPTTPSVGTVPGAGGRPTDTDDDGTCDDVNGNGRRDFADVVLFFNQMAWIAANEPAECFDYNANGRVDFADIVTLFGAL